MTQFVIIPNNIEGVELILKRLRESGCIASSDLADGIDKTLHVLEDGELKHIQIFELDEEPIKAGPFEVIKGGKT